MKRVLFILLMAIATTVGYSQTLKERLASFDNSVFVEKVMELDSLSLEHFYNKEYDEALDAAQKELDALQKAFGADDTICVNVLAFISRCYFRQGAAKKALEYGLKSAELYGEKCSRENIAYANLIDNVALYYTTLEDYKNAEKYSDEAVRIHNKYFVNDKEMGGVLAHAAEIKSILGKIDEAVPLQEHALSVIENDEGNHSEHYLNELKYMKRPTKQMRSLNSCRRKGSMDMCLRSWNSILPKSAASTMRTPTIAASITSIIISMLQRCLRQQCIFLIGQRMHPM